MHSFLKAEWKTILGVFLFCGTIFSWFYYQEIQKEEAAKAPYVYECLNPGVGFKDYQLGSSLDTMASQLAEFKVTRDKTLDLVRYERNDSLLALNFYNNHLTSIEYYIDNSSEDPKCASDINQLKNKQVTAMIAVGARTHLIHDGFIRVVESQPVSDENSTEKKVDETIAWFIVPTH